MDAIFASVSTFFIERHIALREEWLESALKFLQRYSLGAENANNLCYEQWLYTDLKDSCYPSFRVPSSNYFGSIAILQVVEIINVARPYIEQLREIENKMNDDLQIGVENEENEFQRGAKKTAFKMLLSDGETTVSAFEHQPIPQLRTNVQPGCKVIVMRSQFIGGLLLLTPQNCQFLGGYVPELLERNSPQALIRRMPVFQATLSKDLKVPAFHGNPQLNDSNERKRKSNSTGTEAPVQPKMANLSLKSGNNDPQAGCRTDQQRSNSTSSIGLASGTSIVNGVPRQIVIQPSQPVRPSTSAASSRAANVKNGCSRRQSAPNPPTAPQPAISISAQLNQRSRKAPSGVAAAQQTSSTATDRPSTSGLSSTQLQRADSINTNVLNPPRRPALASRPQLSSGIGALQPQVQLIRPGAKSYPNEHGLLTTPLGTNLSMDNFAVPKLQDAPNRQTVAGPRQPCTTASLTAEASRSTALHPTQPSARSRTPSNPQKTLTIQPRSANSTAPRLQLRPGQQQEVVTINQVTPRKSAEQRAFTPTSTGTRPPNVTPLSADSNKSVAPERDENCATCCQMPYRCAHCHIAFESRALHQIHMGLHGFNAPFTCNRCGTESADALSFNMHLYEH